MTYDEGKERGRLGEDAPILDASTRERLGRRMREMYEPVLDEPLDPRLAELLQALEQARSAHG
ncbi:hypothetical protein J2X36_005286 [Methylobacterium sp. BE186]|uniref:hypothetical protein n=1 Tax=Methylobacterium sp. BE186 TaxID=2817715 RepID=UPI00104FF53B|nr:hypothetical protein [Methylobacterium sp. BE186]MDR7040503.1 hypothetical protein [Methylobacterium sp. BE186]